MGRDLPWLLFLLLCGVLSIFSFLHPSALSDVGNPFLKDFMDNDILSTLGFITAVGNASTLSIHLHLNHLEDKTLANFPRVRRSLRKSAVSLVYVFVIVFMCLVLKPLLPAGESYQATVNSVGIAGMYFSLSVLRDITVTVFKIPTEKAIAKIAAVNQDASKIEP